MAASWASSAFAVAEFLFDLPLVERNLFAQLRVEPRAIRQRRQLPSKGPKNAHTTTAAFSNRRPIATTVSRNCDISMPNSFLPAVNSVYEIRVQPYQDNGLSFITPAQKMHEEHQIRW